MILRPLGYNGTQFYLIAHGVMYFINEDRERWQLTDKIAELVSLSVFFIVTFFKHIDLSALLLDTVKNYLFGVSYCNQSEKFGKRLMISNFLNIRVLGFV